MTRLFVALAVGIAAGFFFMHWSAQHAFPTEEEIKNKIHPGMTRDEVVRALGDPASEHRIDARNITATYLPALALRDKFEPGYIGFVVNFEDGAVRDWRILSGEPSYVPTAAAQRPFKWWLITWPTLFIVLLLVRWVRGVPVVLNQRAEMLRAFMGMKIAAHLPADLAFITHDTALAEVVQRAGPPTREINFVVNAEEVSNYPLLQAKNGASAIRTVVYDLPNSDSLIVMPEYPFQDVSLIRAVYCWRGGAGAAD